MTRLLFDDTLWFNNICDVPAVVSEEETQLDPVDQNKACSIQGS